MIWQTSPQEEKSYNRCWQVQIMVGQLIDDPELEAVALSSAVVRKERRGGAAT